MMKTSEINATWRKSLINEFKKSYFLNLEKSLYEEMSNYTIYPPKNSVFEAYNVTPLDRVRVVIIGQDPYHGTGQANGLCFSVNKTIPHPPSLQNIFKELSNIYSFPYPNSGDLTPWAKQGVFLLNSSLTVRKGEANSHKNIGWQSFTDATIKTISNNRDGVIFLLWGGFAKKKSKFIDKNKHIILTSGHPSPLSANRGYWFGNNHFAKVNEIFRGRKEEEIDWKIY